MKDAAEIQCCAQFSFNSDTLVLSQLLALHLPLQTRLIGGRGSWAMITLYYERGRPEGVKISTILIT